MIGRTWFLLGMCVMTLATAAGAQPLVPGVAKAPPTPADLDKIAVDVLKDLHNRGAELYNKGEPLGSLRLYEGALLTVRPFLVNRPAIQKLIDDSLVEIAKTDGIKIQAFRLHEVIEDVRGKLKEEIKKSELKTTELTPPKVPVTPPKVDTPKVDPPKVDPPKVNPTKVDPPKVDPPKVDPPKNPPANAKITGKLTYMGKPVGGAEVVFVSLTAAEPKVYEATTGEDGSYTLARSPGVGEYAVKVKAGEKGPKLPEKYGEFTTSGLKLKVAAGASALDIELK